MTITNGFGDECFPRGFVAVIEQASGNSEKVVGEIQVCRCEQNFEVHWTAVFCLEQLVSDVSCNLRLKLERFA